MKTNYRSEIDGLRAFAVLAVILYHAKIELFGQNFFEGGFIGVDIFFVISGYLITSIILKELVTTGKFSFKYFYERRVRRILPALLFVMLVSLPFAWIYLLPISFIDFSKSILYSLGFSSNFYFHFSGQEYGAESGLLTPFLHTWSLSVEEQYYILFPILLFIIFRYLKKYIILILIISFAGSLGLAEWASRNYHSLNFYILPTRVWELLAGSILAHSEIYLNHRSKNKILNLILPTIGFFLIGYSFLFFDDEMLHPSIYTLLPITGACLIIWFSENNEPLSKILSFKPIVGIGLISYSLYLWHYPIFAFSDIIELTKDDIYKKILLGLVILLLSIISYYFIERPARNKNNNFSLIFGLLIFIFLIILVFNYVSVENKGFEKRKHISKIFKKTTINPGDLLSTVTGKNFISKNIKFSYSPNNTNLILVGDSHAKSLSYNLFNRTNMNKYNFLTSIYSGCQFILNVNRVNKKTLKEFPNCSSKTQRERQNFINEKKDSIIVLFGRLPLILEEERFYNPELNKFEGKMKDFIQNEDKSLNTIQSRQQNIANNYIKTVLNLLQNNHKIIIVYPMPEVGVSVPRYIFNQSKGVFEKKKYFTTSYEAYKKRTKKSFKLLNFIKHDNIYRVFPHKLFCDTFIENRCLTHDDKSIFYFDDDHPSFKGADMINDLIMKEIEKIELNKN